MKALVVGTLALLIIALVPPRQSAVAGDTAHAGPTPYRADRSSSTVIEADRQRITAHLVQAERRLREADVSHLDEERRAAREAVIGHLREYQQAAEYPHNHDFGHATPFFVDHRGIPCAMAYLIARSGAEELVARVAATANNAYVRDLADDPELREWLDRNGMTAAEAAMVQPWYDGSPLPEPEPPTESVQDQYMVLGLTTIAADALSLYLASRGGRLDLPGGIAAVVLGTAGAVFGASFLGEGSANQEALAVANVALGVTTVTFGVGSILRWSRTRPGEDGTATTEAAATGAAFQLAPTFVPGAGLRPGMSLSLRF